ncbi:putative YkwD family protein [Planomicrobium soli]|uniref:Putative YkwD family protein n=1 Tax=Planomicrobium soli TaxID=1176648 RepID=A0A2P8H4G4_9BACL|nr:putative YkwD family protein [Planomicrobium soli]
MNKKIIASALSVALLFPATTSVGAAHYSGNDVQRETVASVGTTGSAKAAVAAHTLSAYEKEIVTLVNKERAKAGLKALAVDTQLSKVARLKSEDMYKLKKMSHSGTYGSPFDMMKKFGITYRAAGENIARGYRSPQEVMKGWMSSPGHRANILNKRYTHIGVGHVASGNYWTQQFIQK